MQSKWYLDYFNILYGFYDHSEESKIYLKKLLSQNENLGPYVCAVKDIIKLNHLLKRIEIIEEIQKKKTR